jgi:1-acyl-sn-glycerol-3-phosphate acyltransferase
MVYRLLRVLANIIIRLYYRKIYISGLDRIPADKPVLIASNHPNGFLEPIIMACNWPRSLGFLVRGDLYDNKFLQPIMKATNQIPIYRFKDGFAGLRNNKKTIATVVEKLHDNNHIIIFIEGGTQAVKYLRPFKKGMGRMVLQASNEDKDLDIYILPLCINFTDGKAFRSDVYLNVGEPFSFKKYREEKQLGDKELIDEVTKDVYSIMDKMVFGIKEHSKGVGKLYSNLTSIDTSNKIITVGGEHFYNLKNKLSQYIPFKKEWLDKYTIPKVKQKGNLLELILAVLLLPVACVALLIYGPIIFIAWLLAKQLVKGEEFISSVRASVFLGISFFLYILALIISPFIGLMQLLCTLVLPLVLLYILYFCFTRLIERNYFGTDKIERTQLEKL